VHFTFLRFGGTPQFYGVERLEFAIMRGKGTLSHTINAILASFWEGVNVLRCGKDHGSAKKGGTERCLLVKSVEI
jgi:hypothetical protein